MTMSATIEIHGVADRPENDRCGAEESNADKHVEAGSISDRMSGKPNRHGDSTDAGGCPQQPETPWPERQDIARKDRHERDRAPEQHGEEIERDRPEHDLLGLYVAESCGDRLPGLGRRRRPLFRLRHGEDHQGARSEETETDRIGYGRTQTVEQSSRHRTDNHCRLPRGRVPGDGIGQVFRGHQIGRQRLGCGAQKSALYAEHDKDRVDRPGRKQSRHRQQEECSAAERADQHADAHDRTAVVTVRHAARHENEEERGQELEKADEAERQWIARKIVYLPADGHRHDLDGEVGKQS